MKRHRCSGEGRGKRARLCLLGVILPLLVAAGSFATEPTLVIENARVIVGNGKVMDGATVVIAGDRIRNVATEKSNLSAARTIDARGKTLMPGLIDTHVHFFGLTGRGQTDYRSQIETLAPDYLKSFIQHGVTTVRSAADPLDLVVELREKVHEGQILGPRILVVGPCFTASGGHPAVTLGREDPWMRSEIAIEVDDEDMARREVRRLATSGVDAMKAALEAGGGPGMPDTMPRLSPRVLRAIVDEAGKHKLRVTVHTHREQDVVDAVESGAHGVEHGVWDSALSDGRLGDLLLRRNVTYTPTLWIFGLDASSPALEIATQNLKTLSDKGVRISVGTDTLCSMPWPGLNTVQEMELMAKAGLTPAKILQAATSHAAEHLGLLQDLGTVEPGKVADLILVDGDPMADISAIRKVHTVIKAGRIVHETAQGTDLPKGIPPNANPGIWFEIPVVDMARARAFYEHVLSVKLRPLPLGPYEMAIFPTHPGSPGATGALIKGEPFQPSNQGVLIYFFTPDVDGTLERVQARAGIILLPKTRIGVFGFVASFEDSEGNRVGVRSWR